jgi:hypothetical protein
LIAFLEKSLLEAKEKAKAATGRPFREGARWQIEEVVK